MRDTPKRRLLVDDDDVTLDCPCYAGGPDIKEVEKSVANIMQPMIDMLMRGDKDQMTVTLTAQLMTDKEVRDLPEM